MKASKRLGALAPYAFAELDKQVARLRAEGFDPIDFGVGDPTHPTPEPVRRAAQRSIEDSAALGYPSYEGEPRFRRAAAEWLRRRFGLSFDPEEEICVTLGSKEAIFHAPEAFADPGSFVLSPSPGYPPYRRGAAFAEARNYFYPLEEGRDFLPDLDAIPTEVAGKARLLWICQPHVPTGTSYGAETLRRIAAFCEQRGILLCSDEAYIDVYFDRPPDSMLQHARRGVLAFFSLSKRSCMTGYRCGFVAGDPEAVALFKKMKTQVDSGAPRFVQDAAVAALSDEVHVEELRAGYRLARDRLSDALARVGLPRRPPSAGLFLWQRAPEGWTGLELAARLLEPDLCLVTLPGAWLAEPDARGANPGRDFVRFALVPPPDRIEEAVRRLDRLGGRPLSAPGQAL